MSWGSVQKLGPITADMKTAGHQVFTHVAGHTILGGSAQAQRGGSADVAIVLSEDSYPCMGT